MTANLCPCCGKPLADGSGVCRTDALSLAETLMVASGALIPREEPHA